MRAAAESYASRNKAHVTRLERRGVDVKVWVATDARLAEAAEDIDQEDTRGEAKARARIDAAGDPRLRRRGRQHRVDRHRRRQVDRRRRVEGPGQGHLRPADVRAGARSNDLVKLGKLLEQHGFTVAENADFGDDPQPGDHSSTGFHYQCRHSGALDVNVYGAPEKPAIDGIVADVQKLGFRTIWQAAGHFDHIHIDVANSGAIGVGGGAGGAVGALEETSLEIKLIDWEAAYSPFGGFGGLGGGGSFAGPPDPDVARTICRVLDRHGASPKVRLAAFETAIVESGVHNLNYGDRDSLGVFQQRPSAGWGTPAQVTNVDYAATQFITPRHGQGRRRQRGAARAVGADLGLPRPLRPGRAAGVRAADQVLLMRASDPRCWRAWWRAAACSTTRARRSAPARRGALRAGAGGAGAVADPRRAAGAGAGAGGRAGAGRGRDRRRRRHRRDRRRAGRAGHRGRRPPARRALVALGRRRRRGQRRVRRATCQPTCASGGTERVPARITLTGVKTCPGGGTSRPVRCWIDPKATPSGQQPATYLRAPC